MKIYQGGVVRAEMKAAAEYIRSEFQSHDIDSRWTLEITVKGSADKADATLEYRLDCSSYYGNNVIGRSLPDAVRELIRRMGFDKEHRAQLLTHDTDKERELERLQTPVPSDEQDQF